MLVKVAILVSILVTNWLVIGTEYTTVNKIATVNFRVSVDSGMILRGVAQSSDVCSEPRYAPMTSAGNS